MLSLWVTLRFLLIHLTVCCLLYLSGAERTTTQRSEYGRTITRELFNSLEELSRIVDISYCVGHTGIWKPFECLSRCDKFQDFELITVSKLYLGLGRRRNQMKFVVCLLKNDGYAHQDMEYWSPNVRLMRLHRSISSSIPEAYHRCISGDAFARQHGC